MSCCDKKIIQIQSDPPILLNSILTSQLPIKFKFQSEKSIQKKSSFHAIIYPTIPASPLPFTQILLEKICKEKFHIEHISEND